MEEGDRSVLAQKLNAAILFAPDATTAQKFVKLKETVLTLDKQDQKELRKLPPIRQRVRREWNLAKQAKEKVPTLNVKT